MSLSFLTMRNWVASAASLPAGDVSMVNTFINEACQDFRRDTELKVKSANFTIVDNQATYSLDTLGGTGIIRLVSLVASGPSTASRPFPVELVDAAQLAQLQTVAALAGTPMRAFVQGVDQVTFYPATKTGAVITALYVPKPVALSADGDLPDEPSHFHRAIVYRALQLAMEWDRQPVEDCQAQEALYMREVQAALAQKKRVGGYQPKMLRPHESAAGSLPWSMRTQVGLD